jgi:hypothetical protein
MTKRRTMMSSVAVAALALGVAGQTPLMATKDAGGRRMTLSRRTWWWWWQRQGQAMARHRGQ